MAFSIARAHRAQARAAVRSVIVPTVLAAFENHPTLDAHEILQLCQPCLVEALVVEFEFAAKAADGRPAA
jgi:hypothetical protein